MLGARFRLMPELEMKISNVFRVNASYFSYLGLGKYLLSWILAQAVISLL